MLASTVEDWLLVVDVRFRSVTKKRVKLGTPQLQIGLIEVADDKDGLGGCMATTLQQPALTTRIASCQRGAGGSLTKEGSPQERG